MTSSLLVHGAQGDPATAVAADETRRGRDLHSEVRAWLATNVEGSLEQIARGVRARTSDVRAVLYPLGDVEQAFLPVLRWGGPKLYRLHFDARDGLGQPGEVVPQHSRTLAILSDGELHARAEFLAAGVQCLNSRIAELRTARRGGHRIECKRVGGSYSYRLVDGPLPFSSQER